MQIRIADIDKDTLCDLLPGCRACVYWEYPKQFTETFSEKEAELKSEWFEQTSAEFHPCGKLLYLDEEPAAYCQYAPPKHIPGISRYPHLASCLDEDGTLISCLCVHSSHQRKGLGRRLLQEVVRELRDRRFGAIQTIARDDSANNCSGPTAFYLAQGFAVVATETFPDGSSFSLVGLDLAGAEPPGEVHDS